jgi:ferritin-like metal-binding protein YciE
MSDIGTTNASAIRYDSSADATGENERHSLSAYVSDLLALEQHIAQPLGGQAGSDVFAAYPGALRVVNQIKGLNDAHIAALKSQLEVLGGNAAAPVKSAWSGLLGGAATLINGVRKTKVTKGLRDDYTALSLATMSYTLLHSTAVGLGDTATAAIARQGLADYARAVMQINQVIPETVLGELTEDGETVATGAAETIRQQTNEIWKSQASVTHN